MESSNVDTVGSSLPIIEIEARQNTGSSNNRRLRSLGFIPSIVYHRGEESLNATVVYKDFYKIASQSTSSQIFQLKSQDKRLDGRTCLVKDVQREFIKGKVLHIDFQSLKDDEEITVRVPIHIVGDSYGVKNEAGILSVAMHDVGVSCLPRQIPKQFVIDVTELKLGDSRHASDIVLPSGVSLEDDPEETIVSVVAVRVVEETPVASAEETDAEGKEAASDDAASGSEGKADAGGGGQEAAEKKDKKK